MKSTVECGHRKYRISLDGDKLTIEFSHHPGYLTLDLWDLSEGEMQELAIMFQKHAAEKVVPYKPAGGGGPMTG